MQNKHGKNWSLWGVMLGGLLVLTWNWRRLEQRLQADDQEQLVANTDIPPSLAITTQAVGPLRGLISNGLWWRAVRLQDEGNFFEAIQLANWISTLQPKLTRVWAYQSWNMAYNITAEIDDPQERWRWIQEGIHLLRNRGLKYNPRDVVLSTEIGQTIMQKIGNDPQYSRYYQRRWAEEMMNYFRDGDRDELERLVAAPDSREELLANPETMAVVGQAAAAGLDLLEVDWQQLDQSSEELNARVRELLADPASQVELQRIDDFRRKIGIREQLNMDPEHILWIDQHYGPLDWRLYQAHVIYWCAPESYDAFEGRESYHHAYVRQALVQAFYDGKLLYVDEHGLSTAANLEIIESTHHYLADYLNSHPHDDGAKGLAKQFHEWAVVLLYTNMYEAEAREVFHDYREHFMTEAERQRFDFSGFIADRAPSILRTPGRSRQERTLVVAALHQAFFWLARGDEHRAAGYQNLAAMLWQRNQKKHARNPGQQLPALAVMKKQVVDFLVSPESRAPAEAKNRLRALRGEAEWPKIQEAAPQERPKVSGFVDAHDHHE